MALSKWVAVIGMLAFGTVSSIMSKVNFQVRGINLNGKVVPPLSSIVDLMWLSSWVSSIVIFLLKLLLF